MGTLPKNTAIVVGADTYNTGVALYEHLPERGLSASRCSHEHPDYQLFIHREQYNLRLRFCQHLSGALQNGADVFLPDWIEGVDEVRRNGRISGDTFLGKPFGSVVARLLGEAVISDFAIGQHSLVMGGGVLFVMLVGQVVVEGHRFGDSFRLDRLNELVYVFNHHPIIGWQVEPLYVFWFSLVV